VGGDFMSYTHTYVTLAVSKAAFDEIKDKLYEAGYAHAFEFHKHVEDAEPYLIDMHGLALTRDGEGA
jgi:hypothetical protein